MADKANHNKHFSAEDIERYHSGQMPVQEMHELEKAALDDPFLADALDGYVYTKTLQADLREIQNRLAEKREDQKVIPIKGFPWLKIAAAVFVVVTAGWLFYESTNQPDKNITLQQKEPEKETSDLSQAQIIPLSADSTQQDNGVTVTNAERTIKSQPSKPSQINLNSRKDEVPNYDVAVVEQDVNTEARKASRVQQQEVAVTDSNVFKNNVAYNRNVASGPSQPRSNFFNGRVVDNYNRAVRNATVVATNNVSVKTDNRGVFTLPAQDTTLNATVKATGFQSNQAKLNLDEPITIVLQPLPSALQEQVVTLSKNKIDSNLYARRQQPRADTLEPEIGWNAFSDYIASNLHEKNEELVKTNEGEVELSFEINSKGEPVNIKVVKSLCEKCDEEAVRLLKEGPKWKLKKNAKKGKVTIKF